MSTLENILSKFPDRVSSGKQAHIFTPAHIAKEMINALPEDIWNKHTTFLDPICKSGIFLYEIYQKLMESTDMIKDFPDKQYRREYILKNQLFGIAVGKLCQMASIRTVYGCLVPDNHIILLNDYQTIMRNTDKRFLLETLQKEFGTMKFDIVIGNPPYNNDAYLDFVQLGHQLSNKYTMMITPAKWQAKGGTKNEQFRKEIVPYMKEIVFYPNSKDIFDVAEQGGISYYTLDKKVYDLKLIKNVDLNNSHTGFNTDFEKIDISKNWSIYNKMVQNIISKTKAENSIQFTDEIKKFNLIATGAISGGNCGKEHRFYDYDNKISVVSKLKLMKGTDNISNYGSTIKVYFQSDNTEECMSFSSYVNTKLVRFLVFIGLCKLSIRDNLTWRFVPQPEAFDHMFTDKELYEKYNLTEEEINIIESVIKERK